MKDQEKLDFILSDLLISTQYKQIECMDCLKQILFSVPALCLEDAYSSFQVKLFGEYQDYLELLKKKFAALMESEKETWSEQVEFRKRQLDTSIEFTIDEERERFYLAKEHLLDYVQQELGEKGREQVRRMLDNEEESDNLEEGSSKIRKDDSKIAKVMRDGFKNLSKEDMEAILKALGLIKRDLCP